MLKGRRPGPILYVPSKYLFGMTEEKLGKTSVRETLRMKSPDSDVSLYYWLMLMLRCNLLFQTDSGYKKELLNITKLAEEHGPEKCSAPFGLHAFTG